MPTRLLSHWISLIALLCLLPGTWVPAQPSAAAASDPEATPAEQVEQLDQPEPITSANLQPAFVTGRHARYAIWTTRHQAVTMRAGGQQQAAESHLEVQAEVDWTVQQVANDGSATCVMTIDWMNANLTLPNGDVHFVDSRQPAGHPESVHRTLMAMTGKPLVMDVAADGSIVAVSGADAIRQQMGQAGNSPEDLELIESASKLATLPFAPPVSTIGESWSATFAWTHEMGTVHHQTRFTLDHIESIADIPIASITAHSTMQLEPDPAKLPQNGPPMDIQMVHGEATTQILFDLLRHEAVGRHAVQSQRTVIRIQLPQDVVERTVDETIVSQTLRIDESG